MCYFTYQLFANKHCARYLSASPEVLFQWWSAGKIGSNEGKEGFGRQRRAGWMRAPSPYVMVVSELWWQRTVRLGGEKFGLISGKGHRKGLEQRKSHNLANEVPLMTKAIYIGKRAAETLVFWMSHCLDRLCNCLETSFLTPWIYSTVCQRWSCHA